MLIGHLCIIFVCYCCSVALFGKMSIQVFPILKSACLLFLLLVVGVVEVLYVFCILIPYQTYDLQILSLSLWVTFPICVCVCVCVYDYASSFATPRTVARQEISVHGCSRQEYWSGLPVPPLGYLPDPRIKSVSLMY